MDNTGSEPHVSLLKTRDHDKRRDLGSLEFVGGSSKMVSSKKNRLPAGPRKKDRALVPHRCRGLELRANSVPRIFTFMCCLYVFA